MYICYKPVGAPVPVYKAASQGSARRGPGNLENARIDAAEDEAEEPWVTKEAGAAGEWEQLIPKAEKRLVATFHIMYCT